MTQTRLTESGESEGVLEAGPPSREWSIIITGTAPAIDEKGAERAMLALAPWPAIEAAGVTLCHATVHDDGGLAAGWPNEHLGDGGGTQALIGRAVGNGGGGGASGGGAVLGDGEALDRIAHWLRDPDWGVGMMEDFAEVVAATGRDLTNESGEATWMRH